MNLGLPGFAIQPTKPTSLFDNLVKGLQVGQNIQQFPEELQKSRLANQLAAITNQYEPRRLEADITGKEIENKYKPEDYQTTFDSRRSAILRNNIMNQLDQQKLKYPGLGEGGIAGDIAQMLFQQDNPKAAQALAPYFASGKPAQPGQPATNPVMDMLSGDIKSQIAARNMKASGLGSGYTGTALKNLMAFKQQVASEHPDWNSDQVENAASSYLSGSSTDANGQPLPPLSGMANQMLTNIQSGNAPVAIKNKAANLGTLVSDLNNFDIDALKSFAGPQGKARLIAAQAKMATNPDDPTIDPMARRYLSAVNQAILNMDQMRTAYGTSVVPDYVYSTMGKLANPSSSIWNDPKQVEQNFKDVLKTMTNNRDQYYEKVKHGVTAELPIDQKGAAEFKKQITQNDMTPETGSDDGVINYKRVNGKLVRV